MVSKSLAGFVPALGISWTNKIIEKLIIELENEKISGVERIGVA